MAKLLWGKVYNQNHFAGYLRQEPGERYTFTYDDHYLQSNQPAIAFSLPLLSETYVSENRLPPFFDNLIAEGWLERAQTRLLGKRNCSRFELLLAFGTDCAGAVTILDPERESLHLNHTMENNALYQSIYRNRASLSGIQPKLPLIKESKKYRPAKLGETSTHIGKLPSNEIPDIIYNEWLSTQACGALLPEDTTVEVELSTLEGICEDALIIKRFDRTIEGQKIYFEEFNSLLNKYSNEKYDGAYKDMADFIYREKTCIPTDVYRLFKRVIVGLIIGNTDMHLKNFACMIIHNKLTLTPNYDQVAAAIYKPYQFVALELAHESDRIIAELKAKHIVQLGKEFQLSNAAIAMAIEEIGQKMPSAIDKIQASERELPLLKDKICSKMEKRWQGTFNSIGQLLSKKR